eukprot:gene14613-31096_t
MPGLTGHPWIPVFTGMTNQTRSHAEPSPAMPGLTNHPHWPATERRHLVGVFTDIDDTLTTDGAITPDALAALHALQAAGMAAIAITGRPIGWCAPFAQTWPVDAMVAENGAVAFTRGSGAQPPLVKRYQQDAATRSANQARMREIAALVASEVPG